MSRVNADYSALIDAVNNISNAASSVSETKGSLSRRYEQLGIEWNDNKYRELGDTVQECNHALDAVSKALVDALKKLSELVKSIKEYEETNIGGGSGYSASGGSGGGSYSSGGASSPAGGSMIVTPIHESILNAAPDTFGSQLALGQDPLNSERFFSQGNHYDEYMNYWENMDDYSFERDEQPHVEFVRARDIEGVYLSDREVADPGGFWTRNGRQGYSRQNILQRAFHIGDVYANFNNGRTAEEISHDPALSDCYASYFADPVQVVRLGDCFVFQADGRHRTLAAQTLDTYIPVMVTGSYVEDGSPVLRRTFRRTR